jgi:uncharacterized protein YjbI with pentapeptide repeats
MANPEHLAILKQGVEVWNKWRDENPQWVLRPDLFAADLSEADLREADLREAYLRRTNLREADLFEANLREADLNWANLRGANLIRADLFEAYLSGADLFEANLNGADLSGAYLSGAYLSGAKLNGADLNGAYLSGANLSGADLSGAKLNGADLNGANLNGANLFEANLSGTNLAVSQVMYTNFHNATLTGTCIKDWQINSRTNLDEVICEYVYLDYEDIYLDCECLDLDNTVEKKERRPVNGNFAPGEFASLYKKIIENTHLIISKTLENDNIVNKPEKNIDVDNTSNNQGVQRSDSTIHTWENLRFRSKTEIKIAEALDKTGVLFVPNSLARLNTPKGRENKEADFLICYNGKWGVLEVDGPFHTAERRVEEQERERIFKKNGIKVVERFDSERCYNNPDEVVQEFFKMIDIGYS